MNFVNPPSLWKQSHRVPDKIKLVVSDLHIGKGIVTGEGFINPMENFYHDETFRDFLTYYTSGEWQKTEIELILNGDIFDMLQVELESKYPEALVEKTALEKIRKIRQGHPIFFEALKAFAEHPHHHLTYMFGNHDPSIIWPSVQEELKQLISPKIRFFFDPYKFDGVWIEHGGQYEVANQFDMNNLFLERKGKKILNLPFGAFFVIGFINKLKTKRPYIDRVRPYVNLIRWTLIFDTRFSIKTILFGIFFFIKTRFVYHPMRFSRIGKTLKIVKEFFKRPKLEDVATELLQENPQYHTIIMGHDHRAMARVVGDKKLYVNSGTWTDIISLDLASLGKHTLLTYAYLEWGENKWNTALKVWKGSPQDHFFHVI